MRLLSPHQIDQFRNDGFLVVENLLDFETVEILRQRFEHLFRGEFETGFRQVRSTGRWEKATRLLPDRSATAGRLTS